MEGFRPEYVDAVAASRWNAWLIPLFFLAPTLFSITTYRRTGVWANAIAVISCMLFTWLSLCFYSEHIWNTMELNAQSDSEWADVTTDTGRLFGPFLVGIPFAFIYTFIWLACCSTIGWAIRLIHLRFTNPKQQVPEQSYSDYRESLLREHATNANEPPTT